MIVVLDTPEPHCYSTMLSTPVSLCHVTLVTVMHLKANVKSVCSTWLIDRCGTLVQLDLTCFRCFLIIIMFAVNVGLVTNFFTFTYFQYKNVAYFVALLNPSFRRIFVIIIAYSTIQSVILISSYLELVTTVIPNRYLRDISLFSVGCSIKKCASAANVRRDFYIFNTKIVSLSYAL
jgi:hypothetical protein